MDNPIRYEDLFNENLIKEVDELRKHLEGVRNGILSDIKEIKKEAAGINNVFNQKPQGGGGAGGGSSPNSPSSTNSQKEAVERLKAVYDKLHFSLDAINKDLLKLDDNQQSVTFTQKELNKVNVIGESLGRQRETSYNALSKEYTALKIVINNLTEEERRNNDEAKRMVQRSKDIYEQMNKMQQATGKHQLSVGNYSKALNGLNIATTQVIRELPVLANGVEQFTIAIGNNIPIWLQSLEMFKQDQEETRKEIALMKQAGASMEDIAEKQKGLMSTGKALLKVIGSWQTIIVVLLTVLPGLIKKLTAKTKAVKELNSALKESITLEEALLKAQKNAASIYANSSSKLRAMYSESQDQNRTMEERLEIGQALIDQFGDEFEGYSKEDIVLGNAVKRYGEVTEALMRQAKARAYMEEITKLESTRMQALLEQANAQEKLNNLREEQKKNIKESEKNAKELSGAINVISYGTEGLPIGVTGKLGAGTKEIGASVEETKLEKQISNLGDKAKKAKEDIESLKNLLTSGDFMSLFDEGAGGSGGKEVPSLFDLVIKSGEPLRYHGLRGGEEEEIWDAKMRFREKVKSLSTYYKNMQDLTQSELASLKIIVSNYEDQLAREIQDIHTKYVEEDPIAKYIRETQEWIDKEIDKMDFTYIPPEKKNPIMEILGFDDDDKSGYNKYMRNIEKGFNLAFKYMQEWMDMRMEMAKVATEAAQKEEDSAKQALDIEQEARANGYAHNVEYARKEYEEKRRIKQQALAEEQRIAAIQQRIDEAQQMSSLLVATANIWATYTKGNVLGAVLAGVATAAMWGSFASAKIQASQLTRTKNYGEGMSEYLDYGGSHASGNDIDFGTMKDGTRRRVERGEMVAVINKRNVSKYGVGGVKDVIGSLNNGTFEDKYGLAFAGLTTNPTGADLSTLEKGMQTLVEQGEKKVVHNGDTTIEYYKNRKRIIKS